MARLRLSGLIFAAACSIAVSACSVSQQAATFSAVSAGLTDAQAGLNAYGAAKGIAQQALPVLTITSPAAAMALNLAIAVGDKYAADLQLAVSDAVQNEAQVTALVASINKEVTAILAMAAPSIQAKPNAAGAAVLAAKAAGT